MNEPNRAEGFETRIDGTSELFLRQEGVEKISAKIAAPEPYLVSPYLPLQNFFLHLLAGAWALALVSFFVWWFDDTHIISKAGFWIVTLSLVWVTLLLPGYFFYFVLRARTQNPLTVIPRGWRVAMIATKVSAEPLSLVQDTLRAMLSQKYPHDTWLADEEPEPTTLTWCATHGVKVISRKNIPEYHRADWPKRAACKEGNLAYFYDTMGYERYDFVVQMDADHIPHVGYLEEILRPFADPAVGYVSAPSICDRNSETSWPARARLFAEVHLHGAQQMGHNNGFAPLCFGSHYAVRIKALKEIGGLGPELAEDHSTTLMMIAAGWHGVHAINATAKGYGPQSFPDFARQEFQWARSLTTILLKYTPRYWGRLPSRLKIQFAFSQLFYPLFSGFMLVFLLLPVIALYRSAPWVNVVYLDFLCRTVLLILPLFLTNWLLIRFGLARPRSAKVLPWEMVLFMFVRWPWSLLGCLMAMIDCVRGRVAAFKITPKAKDRNSIGFAFRFAWPYLAFSIFAIAPVFLVDDPGGASGYIIFTAMNAIIYAFAFFMILQEHNVSAQTAMRPPEALED